MPARGKLNAPGFQIPVKNHCLVLINLKKKKKKMEVLGLLLPT
jgi:hypothetical protein